MRRQSGSTRPEDHGETMPAPAAVARPAWAWSATTTSAPARARWNAALAPSTPAPTTATRTVHPSTAMDARRPAVMARRQRWAMRGPSAVGRVLDIMAPSRASGRHPVAVEAVRHAPGHHDLRHRGAPDVARVQDGADRAVRRAVVHVGHDPAVPLLHSTRARHEHRLVHLPARAEVAHRHRAGGEVVARQRAEATRSEEHTSELQSRQYL